MPETSNNTPLHLDQANTQLFIDLAVRGDNFKEMKKFYPNTMIFDVDYVKVWKPRGEYLSLINTDPGAYRQQMIAAVESTPYKNTQGWINQPLNDIVGNYTTTALKNHRSIAMVSNDELYYHGTNNKLHYINNPSGSDWYPGWDNDQIYYDDIGGDLKYNSVRNCLMFRSTTGKLAIAKKDFNNWTINMSMINVSSAPGSIDFLSNGDPVIIGQDNKIYLVDMPNTTPLSATVLGNYTSWNAHASRDLTISPNNGIFYVGMDDKIQGVWFNGTTHVNVHILSSAPAVQNRYGSLTVSPTNDLFYIDVNKNIQRLYFNSGWMLDNGISSMYYPSIGERALNDIVWDTPNGAVFFAYDGSLKYTQQDQSQVWGNAYVDDYWGTDEYDGHVYPSMSYSSLATVHNGAYYYVAKDNKIRRFIWKSCERPAGCMDGVLNQTNLNRTVKPEDTLADNTKQLIPTISYIADKISVFPNPSNDGVFHINTDGVHGLIQVYSMDGKKVAESRITGTDTKLEISKYVPGIYTVVIRQGDKLHREIIHFQK
jgi:hypothetical protein